MNTVQPVTQFSVFLVNKPGVLAQVTTALARLKINIVAMTLVDSQEHGVLRLVTEHPEQTRETLSRLNLPVSETDVISLDMGNHAGALADVATLLATEHININYAYVTSGAPGGRTTGILRVADMNKAVKILRGRNAKPKDSPSPGRARRRT